MFRIYLTEAIKNIKSRLTLSVIIVLLFVLLIQVLSYSLAWMTHHLFRMESFDNTIRNEAYIEYAIYSLKPKGNISSDDLIRSEDYQYNPDDPENPIVRTLTEEDIAHNEKVVASYEIFYNKLKNIDGLILIDKTWSAPFFSDDGRAYEISLQNTVNLTNHADDTNIVDFFEELGYSKNEVRQFCDYNCVRYNKETILLENFTYCEGRGWTEEDLQFDYLMQADGTLPTVPIVMGYNFKDYYDVGDVIKHPEGGYAVKMFNEGYYTPGHTDQTFGQFVVIGFLDEDTNVEKDSGLRHNLNSYIIVPQVPNTPEYFPNGNKEYMAQDFYSSLINKQIYIDKENEQQVLAELIKVLSEDTVRGVNIYPEKQSQINAVYEKLSEKRTINYAMISGATLVFTVAIMVIIIINKFRSNIKDIAVHRVVGATVADNVKCYLLEYTIYLLCADILTHFEYIMRLISPGTFWFFTFSMHIRVGDTAVYLIYPLMIAMNILILAIVGIVAYICSSRLDVATVIKGKE